jgi:hypothetical protein
MKRIEHQPDKRFDIGKELSISEQINKLRDTIGIEVRQRLGATSNKIERYFQRAFVRWIFNTIRFGRNPFRDKITAEIFISQKDLWYLFNKHKELNHLIDQEIDWSWLTLEFERISESTPRKGSRLKISKVGNFVNFFYFSSAYPTETFTITRQQYLHLKHSFNGNRIDLDPAIVILLGRYKACGSTNNHYSAPPQIVKFSEARTELFGSPFNTCTSQYCSPFSDIEGCFGSLGSFFNFEMSTGVYFMNPPYDEDIMKEAMLKVVNKMKTACEITVIVVIPVWDIESQQKVKGKPRLDRKFDALEIAEKSGFMKSRELLKFDTHRFFNYYTGKMDVVTDSHLFVMSNSNYQISATEIAREWALIKH